METAFFLLDALAITLLVFTSLHNDKLRPGEKQTGFFRFSETRKLAPPPERPSWINEDQS